MPPAARKTDLTVHGGALLEGSPNVTIGFLPAARLLDKHFCPLHGPGPITESSKTVFINGVGAARMGDACTCMIPATGVGGGAGADKGEPVKFGIGREKKFGEKSKEWEKEGKDAWKEKPPEPPTPKIAAELSKEFWKGGNADEKKGAFETGLWESGGQARVGYEGELANLKNAKAEASVKYEVGGAVARAQGQVGDVERGSFAQGGAEGKFLTGKAGASGGAYFEAKDGKLSQAYVGGEAGAGVAVVEGKLDGRTRAFKLPFVNWGISFNGEVSGALLTAEAKASGQAGYKDGKWTFGFGAKLGAAIAGLGFKFGFSIEKIDPPAPAAAAPGIPGFAGIDPIAVGCFTVLIGGVPPPYIPGPPRKEDYGGTVVGDPTNRNKPEALELTPDPIEERRIKNKELAMTVLPNGMTRLQADAAKVHVTPERLAAMTEGKCPLSFASAAVFQDFKKELNDLMKDIGLGDSVLRMKGTSTTFYSENPSKPLGHHFDRNPAEPADVDIGVESKGLTRQLAAAGVSPNPKIPSIFKTKDVMKHYPKLQAFSEKWGKKLGRDVNFVGLVDPSRPPAAATDYLL